MDASELRIGNLVDLYGSVATIGRFDFNETPPKGLAMYKGSPIPLTEEWLFRLGFEKQNNAWIVKSDIKVHNIRGFQFSIWKDLTYNTGEISPPLEYVHQLQNLYFVLTGQELKQI